MLISSSVHTTSDPIDFLVSLQFFERSRWVHLNIGGRGHLVIHQGAVKRARMLAGIFSEMEEGRPALNHLVTEVLLACATAGAFSYEITVWDEQPQRLRCDPDPSDLSSYIGRALRRIGERYDAATFAARRSCASRATSVFTHGVASNWNQRLRLAKPLHERSVDVDDRDIDQALDALDIEPPTRPEGPERIPH